METQITFLRAVPAKFFVTFTSLCLTLFPVATLRAQSTNIAITSTTLQPSVKRLGINLGTLTNYDSGQITQNLVMQNPGFEGQLWNSTIRCASGSANSCTDENSSSAWPNGFWTNATYEVFYGAAAGRTGKVVWSSAAGSGQGGTIYFGDSGVAPAAGDYVIVRQSIPGGATGGWNTSVSGQGVINTNLNDLPPGTLGKQTAVMTAPSASDSATISAYFDSTSGKAFVQFNGQYQIQFKAKGNGGTNQLNVKLSRMGVAVYVNQAVNLTGSWNTYNLTFTATENGSAVGTVGLSFSTVGSDEVELDDVSVTKMNGDPTNTSAFRDPVVNALRTLQPGILRFWGGNGQLGETLDNLIVQPFGRQRAGFSAWSTESDQISYGLHDFLVLCQLIGAEPWVVVPTTFSTTDASNLIEYLAGSSTTTYGAKRSALGQATPWSQVFSKIHIEFGNEAWNSTFKGGSIEYPGPYGGRSQTIFGLMRANPSYVSSVFDLVLGGQAAGPARNTEIQNACNNNDSFSVAPYMMNQVDSYTDNESLFGSTFAEPEAYMSSSGTAEGLTPGMVYQDYQAIQNSTHPVPLSFYEANLSTLSGAITQQGLNSYVSSLGAGLSVVDTMLLGLRQFGVVNQGLFALPQYDFYRSDGKSVFLWGAVVDMGVTDRRRPQYLALQLANQAISPGAAMLQTVHTGADPTWNQPLVNSVQFSAAHYLHSFAFFQNSNYSLVVFNLSRTSTLPVTFSGANAPAGQVQMQQLTSANPTDTNENSNIVNITPSTSNNFNPSTGLTLPPYSMTVLNWSSTTTPPGIVEPVITAVAASGITSNSATVTWTTDQPSSSAVTYGINNSTPSTAQNATLVTSHSVTLSGLTPGATYIYTVASTSSSGTNTSATNTFSTSAPPPPASNPLQLSSVAYWGITGSSITMSWSSNEPATTAVAYGTTSALGQVGGVQSQLSTNHAVTLAGLAPGTTYYFVAQSTDANGNAASSSTYSFSTLVTTAPVISGVSIIPGSNNEAQISWTTSVPTTSYVQFGLTTAYGKWSSATGLTTNPSPAMGYVPSGVVHYQLVSTDASGNQTISPDSTFTEP